MRPRQDLNWEAAEYAPSVLVIITKKEVSFIVAWLKVITVVVLELDWHFDMYSEWLVTMNEGSELQGSF